MDNRPAVISPTWWIAAIVLLAIVVGLIAVWRTDRTGSGGSGLSERYDYGIEEYEKIDPALIAYEETGEIPTGMQDARAVAVGLEDRVYVAGDEAIHAFDSSGKPTAEIRLEGEPTCLAVGGPEHAFPGRIYVGAGRTVNVLDPDGKPFGAWEIPGEKVLPTSIAPAKDDVFVADFANRVVLRYDTSGQLVGRIGEHNKDRGIIGFVLPSPFFDVAVAAEDVLWAVNPGLRRLEAYTFDGNLELFWGESGTGVEGFFGCCNPAHLAILPDGSFVTAEKGLLRVKVYTADGQFDCVVAGPEHLDTPAGRRASPPAESRFDHEYKAVDVAVDSRGRILILDPARAKVRVFQRKRPVSELSDEPST
jgi:hypothetical protein